MVHQAYYTPLTSPVTKCPQLTLCTTRSAHTSIAVTNAQNDRDQAIVPAFPVAHHQPSFVIKQDPCLVPKNKQQQGLNSEEWHRLLWHRAGEQKAPKKDEQQNRGHSSCLRPTPPLRSEPLCVCVCCLLNHSTKGTMTNIGFMRLKQNATKPVSDPNSHQQSCLQSLLQRTLHCPSSALSDPLVLQNRTDVWVPTRMGAGVSASTWKVRGATKPKKGNSSNLTLKFIWSSTHLVKDRCVPTLARHGHGCSLLPFLFKKE